MITRAGEQSSSRPLDRRAEASSRPVQTEVVLRVLAGNSRCSAHGRVDMWAGASHARRVHIHIA